MPDSDQQTFRIAVPRQLRAEYDRIIMPVITTQVSKAQRIIYCIFIIRANSRRAGRAISGV